MLSIHNLVHEVGTWAKRNFGERPKHQQVLGINEEIGELIEAFILLRLSSSGGKLSHAQLKMEQKIRGSEEKHIADMKDALGDIIIYMADFCYVRGFDLEEIITETWAKVSKRDWKKDSLTAGETPQGKEAREGKLQIGFKTMKPEKEKDTP